MDKLRVLHVEDDLGTVAMVETALRDVADVESVDTLERAQIVLAREGYDLILLDLRLPDAKDVEAIVALHPYHIPIVVLSALSAPDTLANAAQCGADDYIVKPVPDKRALWGRLQFVHSRHARKMGCRSTVGSRLGVDLFEYLKPFISPSRLTV